MSETLYYGGKNIAGLSNVTASAFYGTFVGSASQLTGIPTGPTGPQGTTGPTGITGPTGFTGPGYGPYQTATGTSISPIVGGSVIVTLLNNLQSAFFVNQTVRVAINTSTYFDGIITNIAGLNYTIQVDFTTTASATGQWTFGLTGQRGAIGWTGPTGPAPSGSAGGMVYLTANQQAGASLPADLVWDNTNGRFGIKNATPAYRLDVTGNARITTDLTLGTALAVSSGGTSAITQQGAINVIAGAVTSGSFLRGDGTNVSMSVIQNGDLPATISRTVIAGGSVYGPIVGSNTIAATTVTATSLVGNLFGPITGSNTIAASSVNVSGTISASPFAGPITGTNTISCTTITASSLSLTTTPLAIASGGTASSTKSAAFDALSPMTTQGDIIYGGTSGTGTRLAIGTSSQLLHGGVTPTWGKLALDTEVINTLSITNGGTGSTTAQAAINALVGTQTNNRVLRSDGTNITLAQVGLTTDVTGTLPLLNGGTGQTTAQAAMNSFAGATTNAQFLRGNGTNVVMSAIQSSDVPNPLNQNTTGTSGGLTGSPAITVASVSSSGAISGTTIGGTTITASSAFSGPGTSITGFANGLSIGGSSNGQAFFSYTNATNYAAISAGADWNADATNPAWHSCIHFSPSDGRVGLFYSTLSDDSTGSGWVDYTVPTGAKTAYLAHLNWSNCRYFDIYGRQSSDAATYVFIHRHNAINNIVNVGGTNHSGAVVIPIVGVQIYDRIRVQLVKGRAHLMGVAWSADDRAVSGMTGTGQIAADNVFGTVASATTAATCSGNSSTATTATTATNQSGGTVSASSIYTSGTLQIQYTNPTITFSDTDEMTAYLHCNSNLLYILRGGVNAGPGAWTQVNGQWPFYISLANNNAQFGGAVAAVGDISAYSDVRYKTNLVVIPDALNKVSALKGYTFNRTNHDDKVTRYVGVIAQEVLEVLPEAVSKTDDDHYKVAYGNMVALLIEAIKEERQKRESLEQRIEKLEKLLNVV